ncbi:MAG: metal-dependent exonucleaseMrfB [Anaerolineae bacterium]
MDSLSERLKALGVKIGARDLPPPRPRDPYPIQMVVPGRFQETPYGEVFSVEQRHPLARQHGSASLSISASLQVIAEWAREPGLARLDPRVFAFLDIETTGLAGGSGTYAFLVGIGCYEDDQFHLAQFFMRDPAEEPALLWALTEFLQPCQALVTFNGKAFDVPLLNARYITNSREAWLLSIPHLDLLPLARRLWSNRLPSRTLGYLEEHVLSITRAQEDVPGWVIPGLYFNYLRNGDARPLKGIFYHNAMDVLSMAALLSHIADLLDVPGNMQWASQRHAPHALDLVAIGRLFEDLSRLETAAQLYAHSLRGDLPEETHRETVRRLSFVQKRRGKMLDAVALWRQAADSGQLYACVELAKYYEHQARGYRQAANWTQTAIALTRASDFPPHLRQRWLAELRHRLARLRRKLGAPE